MEIEKVILKRGNNYLLKTDKATIILGYGKISFCWGEIDNENEIDENEILDIPIPIGDIDMIDISELIEFYQDKKHFLEELNKIIEKYESIYYPYKKFIGCELLRIAKIKDEKELNNFLVKLEKKLENCQKRKKIQEELFDNLKEFSYDLSYWYSDFDGKRVIIINIGENKFIVVVCSNETAEIRTTENLAIIYDIVYKKNLNKITRLPRMKEKDIKDLKEKVFLLIKALIFDLEENVKNKVINLLTLSSI